MGVFGNGAEHTASPDQPEEDEDTEEGEDEYFVATPVEKRVTRGTKSAAKPSKNELPTVLM